MIWVVPLVSLMTLMALMPLGPAIPGRISVVSSRIRPVGS
jgi:hypothetical protein